MAEGELGAVFDGLAKDADQAAGNISESVAKFGEQTADTEEANVARTLDSEASNAKSFSDITDGGGADAPTGTSPSGPGAEGESADAPKTPETPPEPAGEGSGNPASGIDENNTDPAVNSKTNDGTPDCGDPVDVSTGRVFLDQVDVDLPGTLRLVLARAHRSDYRVGRSFGPSWASTLDQRVEIGSDAVHFAAADGMLLRYPMPGPDGSVLPEQGSAWPLSRSADGGYQIRNRATGLTVHFAASGSGVLPLAAITDDNGNRVDVDRDEYGTPTAVRHSGGYHIDVRTADGLIVELRLANPADGAHVTLMRYRYDEDRRLTEVINSSEEPLRFDYDDVGRIVRWEDRNGEWYRYEYDDDGRCAHTVGSGGVVEYFYSYDRAGLVTTATNALGHTTSYQLNEGLQVVSTTDESGNTSLAEWDRHHRLLSRTDPLGRVTRYDYDERGDLVGRTRPDGTRVVFEYDASGRPNAVIDPTGAVWRQEYDEHGNRVASIDPSGARTSYAFDERGGLTTVTDPLGNTTRIQSDAVGLPVEVVEPSGARTRYARDVLGRVSAITDPVGGVIRFGWTVEGKPLWRTMPDGATQRWSYDGEGNQIRQVGAAGQVAESATTHFDLLAAEVRPDGSRLEYHYDRQLRLVGVTNGHGLTWHYEYDPVGNLVQETDFNGRVLRYRHDAAGQLIERTNGLGQTTRFVRDLMGNVIRQESDDGTASFAYDQAGRLVRARNAEAEVVFERDALGRVVAEGVNGRAVGSAFDALGRRVERVTPSGARSRWEYGATGRPVALRTAGQEIRFDHDIAGREIQRRIGSGTLISQAWDANDRLHTQTVTVEPPGGADRGPRVAQRRSYRYRADGLVTAIIDQIEGLREVDLDPSGRVVGVRAEGWTERYAYDGAGNIAFGTGPETLPDQGSAGEREYAGGLLRRAGRVSYQHDAQGRVIERRSRTLSGQTRVWRYGWNADDRLVEVRTPGNERWRYRYDPLGRRIDKQRLAPDDDAVLERVEFSWDGTFLAEQAHSGPATDTRVTTWDWEPGTFRPVSQTERVRRGEAPQEWFDERFHAIVSGLAGEPTELIAPDGELSWRMRYSVWGIPSTRSGNSTDTPLRFAGQYFDAETGFNYNYHRYYDPAVGRYVSNDPLGLAPGPNPQAYVDNPLVFTDPLGLVPCYLTQTGPNTYQSPAGLEYGPDPSPSYASRADHVLHHANEDLPRPAHGVFGAGSDNEVFQDVDEAYRRVLSGDAVSVPQGGRVVHYVNMGRDIGLVGGQAGAATGNPVVRYIQLVTEGGNRVITAYPVPGIPSSVLGP